MPRLSLWPSRKCQACKGQPTPPPCYQCTFSLQNPPPKYTSLPSHVQQSWIPSRSPSLEESPPSYYLEDPEENEEDLALQQQRFYENADLHSEAIFGSPQASDTSVLTLTQSLGRIALAMVPPQPAWQPEFSPTPPRSRHRSSPGRFAATGTRDVFPRLSHGSLLASHLELSDRVRHSSSEHSSRSASPGPQLLLTALTSRLSEGSDLQGMLNTPPLSPRSVSPLPSQLLIPE